MRNPVLDAPLNAIVFDCDGTLSKIEGINVLAETNHVGDQVTALTEEAMAVSGLSPDLYAQRLLMIRPSYAQILVLGNDYFVERVAGSVEFIQKLQAMGKAVYIVSAGILKSVQIFAEKLRVPDKHVFAVPVYHDEHGNYAGFDSASVLIQNNGKRQIIQELRAKHPRLGFVGDGMNDLCCQGNVTRFVGFGGVFPRDNIAAQSEFYVTSSSLLDVEPFLLTADELAVEGSA